MFQYKKFYLLMNLSKHKLTSKIYFSDNVEILKLICLKNEYNSSGKITPMLAKDEIKKLWEMLFPHAKGIFSIS